MISVNLKNQTHNSELEWVKELFEDEFFLTVLDCYYRDLQVSDDSEFELFEILMAMLYHYPQSVNDIIKSSYECIEYVVRRCDILKYKKTMVLVKSDQPGTIHSFHPLMLNEIPKIEIDDKTQDVDSASLIYDLSYTSKCNTTLNHPEFTMAVHPKLTITVHPR